MDVVYRMRIDSQLDVDDVDEVRGEFTQIDEVGFVRTNDIVPFFHDL